LAASSPVHPQSVDQPDDRYGHQQNPPDHRKCGEPGAVELVGDPVVRPELAPTGGVSVGSEESVAGSDHHRGSDDHRESVLKANECHTQRIGTGCDSVNWASPVEVLLIR